MDIAALRSLGLPVVPDACAAQVYHQTAVQPPRGSPLSVRPAQEAAPQAKAQDYTDSKTWDKRFEQSDSTFDWYATYKELEPVFDDFSPPSAKTHVLMVGCGNSELSAEMHQAGYTRITNIDISPAAIDKMAARYASLDLQWKAMDATNMEFGDNQFDLAVDKGTVDAMMAGSDGTLAAKLSAEVWRTLRPGGVFLIVSHNGKRQPVLDSILSEQGHPWQRLELRRNCLSPQAMLINVIRSKITNGGTLAEAFRNPILLKEAADETQKALKKMKFLEAFRMFKAKKARQRKEAGLPEEESKDDSEQDDEERDDPRRQPYCWVYVLRKKLPVKK